MTSRLRRRVAGRGDDGAALLLALIFIAVVAAVIASLLPYIQTGTAEAAVAREVRSQQNATDGAVKGAIESIRRSLTAGTAGVTCPTYQPPANPALLHAARYRTTVGGTNTDADVVVTCQQAPGAIVTSPDVPPYAIVTTSGGIVASGNNTLSIDGGVYSSGSVTAIGGAQTNYLVVGDVFVKPATPAFTCSFVTAVPGPACPAAALTPAFPSIDYDSALGPDAATAEASIAALPADPYGTCAPGQLYVRFQPGYYSQIPKVDPVSCASGSPSLYWFAPCASPPCAGTTPGVYYFDFADASYPGYTNKAVWDLNAANISVMAGSLKANWQTQPTGKRCNPTAAGVQIVLGGPSQLITGNGADVEICASRTSATSSQRIALYGLSQSASYGIATPAGPRSAAAPVEVAPQRAQDTPSPDSSWTNADGARQIGDTSGVVPVPNIATATFNGTVQSRIYGADLDKYNTGVPDGSLIQGASFHILHAEAPTSGHIDPQIIVTYSDNTTDTCTLNFTNGTTLVDSTVNLMSGSACSNHLRTSDYRWRLLKGVKVTYEAVGSKQGGNNPTGTAAVDGVQLVTTYVAPALEAERCQTGQPTCYSYSNSFSDANDDTFFIGTVFTPDEPMHVIVHNNPDTIFQRGVIVSALEVKANASSKQTDSPFQLPHSAAIDRTVLFTATTVADGKVRLRARVHYIDCAPAPACLTTPNALGNQVYPGRLVEMLEWTVLH